MTNKDFQHKATFVGMNGSMGLVRGRTYSVKVYRSGEYLWVEWVTGRNPITGRVRTNRCPYGSAEKVRENWVPFDSGAPDNSSNTYSSVLRNTVDVMLWRRTLCTDCDGYYAVSNHTCDGCVRGSEWRKADESYVTPTNLQLSNTKDPHN